MSESYSPPSAPPQEPPFQAPLPPPSPVPPPVGNGSQQGYPTARTAPPGYHHPPPGSYPPPPPNRRPPFRTPPPPPPNYQPINDPTQPYQTRTTIPVPPAYISEYYSQSWHHEVRTQFQMVHHLLDEVKEKLTEVNGSVKQHQRDLYGGDDGIPGVVKKVYGIEKWVNSAETTRKLLAWGLPVIGVGVLTDIIIRIVQGLV